MSQILIINLRKFGDIYSSSHLIKSLTEKYPHSQVSILVYKEFETVANTLQNVSSVYTINRKEVITLRKNDLFSNGFALETLYNELQPIKNTRWDHVINYSNDKVSTYLSSYLRSSINQFTGIRISPQGRVQSSSDWDIVFNDVLTTFPHTPIHFVDCYHHMTNTPINSEGVKLKSLSNYNEIAFKNLNDLRKNKSSASITPSIIGVQLAASTTTKSIHEESLKELLQLLTRRKDYEPILLIAPIESERSYAKKLNTLFDHQLVVVESDFQALPSVLMNIDALITPDTSVKHAADLVETPVIEVSSGEAPFLKQGSYNKNSLIITEVISNRTTGELTYRDDPSLLIKASDIISALDHLLSGTAIHSNTLTPGLTIYKPQQDELGLRYEVLCGSVAPKAEISRLLSRYFLSTLFEMNNSNEIFESIYNNFKEDFHGWTESEKKAITSTTKILLKTLRSLLGHHSKSFKAHDFIASLNLLLHKCDQEYIVALPLLIFRAKIENIETANIEENIKEVEILLHELKNDIQKVFNCIKETEIFIENKKKDLAIHHNHHQVIEG